MNGGKRPPSAVPVAVPVALSNPVRLPRDSAPEPRLGATTPSPREGAVPERAGRRALATIRGRLSQRDWAILRSVDAHRYLSTRQVEGFHFANHATPLTGARVARRVLRRLATDRVLQHLDRTVGGLRAGSASYVWQVGPVGDRLVRIDQTRPRRRQREPSRAFLDHHLAAADAHLRLVQADRTGELELVDVELEPACWRRYSGLGGGRLIVKPDLFVSTSDPADADYLNTWFVEIDRGTEHPARLLAKCAQYEAYWQSGTEQRDRGGFPLVVWVMRDPAQVERLRQAIGRTTSLDQRLYRVTTTDQLSALVAGGAV